MREVGPEGVVQLLTEAPGTQVVDIREDWELELARFPIPVIHIPMDQIRDRVDELDPERPVVVACRSGNRSRTVSGLLEHNGFKQVINLDGGILAWSRELDPSIPSY
jgi:rhodanese-related sulfurtransferase